MAGFSSEEILDLLYKKVAFGANKSGTSEQFSPAEETSSSFIAVKPGAIWREANNTNVPTNPPSATSSYVQVYTTLESGSQPASTTAVKLCTANADAQAMPGQTNFKRSWSTGLTNWIGPTFGAGYLVKVYVGPANWDGDTTDSDVTQVIFGSNSNRDWYFDYEAGMLYWTPENENGTGSFEDSDSWTTFTDSHVVYIAGYRYIGATGTGGSVALTDLSVGADDSASGGGGLAYNDTSGVFTYTPPDLSSFLTSETSHADVVVDGDFGSQGIMLRGASSGNYSILADNSSNWNTAYSWGDHSTEGYLTSETSHADVLVDGDFATSGIMATNGSGTYSIVTNNSSNWNTAYGWGDHSTEGYLTSETSHADVLVDGDFGSQGIMLRGVSSGNYSILTDNSANWNTAYGWGDHSTEGYLTSETSHADVLVDGDFSSSGIMATNGSGTYSIVTNNSSNWNTAYGWGDHSVEGYLTSETSHADVLVDGDFSSAGIMATNGSGTYSIVTNNSANWNTAYGWGDHSVEGYLTSETSHADVLVDGDFASSGIMATNGSGTYSIVTNNSANWNTAYGWGDHSVAGYAVLAAGTNAFTGNVSIGGTLTVVGDFISQEATVVTFRDAFLDINVANTISDYVTNSGFRFGRSTDAADQLDEMATMTYFPAGDVAGEDYTDGSTVFSDFGAFRFTRHTDSSTGAVASADNVLSLKFNKQDTCTQVDQSDGETNMDDGHEANATVDRSLGAIAKARITITNTAGNGDSGTDPDTNYAPDTAGALGYPIRHNLATQSVYVIAIKDPAGTPTPVFCKYKPIDNAHVRVTVGVTAVDEVYDIIVIG